MRGNVWKMVCDNISVNYLHPKVDTCDNISLIKKSIQKQIPTVIEELPDFKEITDDLNTVEAHKVTLNKYILSAPHTAYAELMLLADKLKDHVADEEKRIKLAAEMLIQVDPKRDIAGAIDGHLKEIDSQSKMLSDSFQSGKDTIEHRTKRIQEVKATYQAKMTDLLNMLDEINDEIEKYDGLIKKADSEIKSLDENYETPLDIAVKEIKDQMLKVKSIIDKST